MMPRTKSGSIRWKFGKYAAAYTVSALIKWVEGVYPDEMALDMICDFNHWHRPDLTSEDLREIAQWLGYTKERQDR